MPPPFAKKEAKSEAAHFIFVHQGLLLSCRVQTLLYSTTSSALSVRMLHFSLEATAKVGPREPEDRNCEEFQLT